MKKRVLIACVLAFLGVLVALTLLGRKILPCAPIQTAWIVPLGADGWEYVMMRIADEGATRESLTRLLGDPDEVSTSGTSLGPVYLHYTNHHDPRRDVSFAVGPDRGIMYAAPGRALQDKEIIEGRKSKGK